MICSRLSSGRFSQNSNKKGNVIKLNFNNFNSKRQLMPRQNIRVVINGSTFDFVGSGGSDLSFAVFQEVLEGWNQVVFSDLGSDGFLELDKAAAEQ